MPDGLAPFVKVFRHQGVEKDPGLYTEFVGTNDIDQTAVASRIVQ